MKLGNPKNTIEVIQKYDFDFQKKFGQNFLIDERVLEKIISAAEVNKDDFVLEIGPGIGTMTQYLAENAREVMAVEIDKNLIPILSDTLSAYDNVSILNADILKVDIAKLSHEFNINIGKKCFYFSCCIIFMTFFIRRNIISHCLLNGINIISPL